MNYKYVIRGLSKFGETTTMPVETYEEIKPQLVEVYFGKPGEETVEKMYPVSQENILEKE